MRKRLRASSAAFLLSVCAVLASTPSAGAAPNCTSDLCLWSGTGYKGTMSTAGYFGKNTHCYFDGHYNSAINRSGYGIRMFNGQNCTGPEFTLGAGKRVAETRFVVHSFRRA